jgi:uncharacterized protein with beta-barrel porin domain
MLSVGGNASLGGTLQLISLGFVPEAGNKLTLVTTGGVVSSRFAQFVNPFATGPGFNTVDLVYGRNSVLLEFLNVSPPVPPVVVTTDFSSFAFTPNQSAAGNLLDAVQLDPRAANLILDGDGNAQGYNFTTGGVSLGIDFRITESTGDRCDGRLFPYLDLSQPKRSYRRR